MTTQAKQKVKLNYLKIAPRKVRRVADLIRGLSVNDAEAQLLNERRRAAPSLLKLLRSAVAAANITKQINPTKAYIETITVDKGPMLKRFMPRAQGSMSEIQKKMSHVTLILAESEKTTNRFKIVIQKKIKKETDDAGQKIARKKGKSETETVERKPKQHGFFKKVFSRNTGDK